jgi:hypothetical protein
MSFILNLLGWNDLIKYKGTSFKKSPFVGCLSHTSGVHEFLLWFLYSKTCPYLRKNFCIVMAGKNNPLFDKQPWKWVLSQVNIILLGDKRWETPQGYVKYIANEVRKNRYKALIIAPTGKDKEVRPWKSGYYNIAKNLGWGFRVVGFDFNIRRMIIGSYVKPGMSLNKTQKILQSQMGDIVPLRIKNSPVPIRKHDPKKVFFLDKKAFFIPIILLITLIILILVSRKKSNRGIVETIFHILISLYGLYLQTNDDVVINCAGLSIIYQHIFVIYMGLPRLKESVIFTGALLGVIIGITKNEKSVYIPFLYSLLSKIPNYAKTLPEQCRVIATVIVISIIINKLDI